MTEPSATYAWEESPDTRREPLVDFPQPATQEYFLRRRRGQERTEFRALACLAKDLNYDWKTSRLLLKESKRKHAVLDFYSQHKL
jgi:hypothetical protein